MAYITTLSLGQLVMLLPECISRPFILSLTALTNLDLYAEDAIPLLFTITMPLRYLSDRKGQTDQG